MNGKTLEGDIDITGDSHRTVLIFSDIKTGRNTYLGL